MHHIQLVKKYLEEHGVYKSITPSGLPFITISREAGAGGHLLAHVIITDLLKEVGEIYKGWEVCDKEICLALINEPGLTESINDLMSEKISSEWSQFIQGLFTGKTEEYSHHKTTFNVIRMIAMMGKAVIVGRGGAFVTSGIPGGIHIRLIARKIARIRWMMKKFKLEHEQAEMMIDEQDQYKMKLADTFFHADIADPINYHCVWNTETTSMHEISRSVIDIIKMRLTAK